MKQTDVTQLTSRWPSNFSWVAKELAVCI